MVRRLGSVLVSLAHAGAVVALTVVAAALLAEVVVADPKRGHVFPVRGPHGDRGGVGEFGAPRNGGRSHEGFDITAPCGTKLVAARGGRVLQNRFDAELDGNEVLIHARGTGRNYRYSHLRGRAVVAVGEMVRTGQRIGGVGKTGNAVTVGCHLHFEMRIQGVATDPEPALRRWDRFS